MAGRWCLVAEQSSQQVNQVYEMVNVCFSPVAGKMEGPFVLLLWMTLNESLESSSLWHSCGLISFICVRCHTVILHVSVHDRANQIKSWSAETSSLRAGCSNQHDFS